MFEKMAATIDMSNRREYERRDDRNEPAKGDLMEQVKNGSIL